MIKVLVCHRPDGLEESDITVPIAGAVCHRPDGLEEALLRWGMRV